MKKPIILIILSLGCWVGVHAQTPQKISYTYDALNRLTVVTYPNGDKITYNYDVLGNRTSVVTNANCTPPSPPTLVSSVSTIQVGQSATLTASNCAGTVTWDNGLGTGSSKIVSPATTTTYSALCTVSGCTSANSSVPITVLIPQPCINTLTHSGAVDMGIYQASETIISSGNVEDKTFYNAGRSITLTAGFMAGGNEVFEAKIQGCTNTPTNILQDDFNDNAFDNTKWQRDNTTDVFENAGVLKLEQNQTDVPTNLFTNWIAIEQNKTLVITRKVWVSPSTTNSYYANFYYGSLSIRFNNDPNNSIYIGYQRDGYNGGAYGTPTDGLIIVSSLTGASAKIRAGNNIFGTWFDEKIEYSISTGILKYYQNNSLLATYNAGLPNSTNLNFSLNFSPVGWWTGHKHYMDDISVSKF